MARDIGIDLGTTFSALAVAGRVDLSPDYPADGIYLDACDVTIIPTPYGEPTFASVIADDPDNPGSYLFAADAVAAADADGAPIMFAKRGMGTQQKFKSRNGDLSAPEVATLFLQYLRTCAEQALGEPVARAVVTHPAYFDRAAVEATRSAAESAGFDMSISDQMLMEPVAAALAYTYSDERDPLQVLAYDLGGGTFDVSFLERRDGVIAMRAFDGNNLLGGYNFDRALVQWIANAVRARGRELTLDRDTDAPRVARLLQLAERVKLDLADAPSDTHTVRIRGRGVLRDDAGREVPIDEKITRAEFVHLISDYLDQTIEQCRATLAQTDTSWEEIDLVLLVGGSTRGPWVAQALQAAFPNARCKLFEPDLCVAAGAALFGARTLPQSATNADCVLSLDVARQSTMEEIDIGGEVTGLTTEIEVRLYNCDQECITAQLDENNSFLFGDQPLNEGVNPFVIEVVDPLENVLLRHEFEIVHAPDGEETTVMSVLPRALLVETVNGLVPIANAGAELPVRCEESFQRQNANPSLTLRLFQDRTAIGEVRIDDIPPEGGIGARVAVVLDITPTGELVGEATIFAPGDEQPLLSRPVQIHIKALQMPDRDDLEAKYAALREKLNSMDKADIEERVTKQCERIDDLLTEVLDDPQEIAAAIDRLEILVTPAVDELDPPHASFLALADSIRSAIDDLRDGVAPVELDAGADELSVRRAKRRQQSVAGLVSRLDSSLEALVSSGELAYANRDRRTWGTTNSAMQVLLGQARERNRDDTAPPPAVLTRIHGSMYINELITRLNGVADRLSRNNQLADWQAEIRRIFNGLHAGLNRVNEITDTTSDEQAMAIRRLAEQSIQPLIAAINNIGVDLARVGESTVTQGEVVETSREQDDNVAVSLLGAGLGSLAEVLAGGDGVVAKTDDHGNTPLMLAASSGDPALLMQLIERGAALEARNDIGRTALMFCNNAETAACLLDAGADLTATDNDGVDSLIIAANEGHESMLRLLITRGADLERRWSAGQTPLLVAARAGQLACVDQLLTAGADVDAVCNNQRSALHHAAEVGAVTVVRRLLDESPSINAVDLASVTPLFLAAELGHAEIVIMLLAHKADPNLLRAADRGSPLMVASWQGHLDVVQVLLPVCEDLEASDHDGDTALINAALTGHTQVIETIAQAGADLDAANHKGQTALMVAAFAGNPDAVALLLTLGADASRCDLEGRNVLDYAQAGPETTAAQTVALLNERVG